MSVFGLASSPRMHVVANPLAPPVVAETPAPPCRSASASSLLHGASRTADVLGTPGACPTAAAQLGVQTPFQNRVRELQSAKRYVPHRHQATAAYMICSLLGIHLAIALSDAWDGDLYYEGLMRGQPRPLDVRQRIFADMGAVAGGRLALHRSKRLVKALQAHGFLSLQIRDDGPSVLSMPTAEQVTDLAPAGIGVNAERVVAILAEIHRMQVETDLKNGEARQAALKAELLDGPRKISLLTDQISVLTGRAAELAAASADEVL